MTCILWALKFAMFMVLVVLGIVQIPRSRAASFAVLPRLVHPIPAWPDTFLWTPVLLTQVTSSPLCNSHALALTSLSVAMILFALDSHCSLLSFLINLNDTHGIYYFKSTCMTYWSICQVWYEPWVHTVFCESFLKLCHLKNSVTHEWMNHL